MKSFGETPRFGEAVSDVAKNWFDRPISYADCQHRYQRYDKMSSEVLKRTIAEFPEGNLPPMLITGNAPVAGFRIFGRYIHMASVLARQQNVPAEDLIKILKKDKSFGSLTALTHESLSLIHI